jgi:hypothetical protein
MERRRTLYTGTVGGILVVTKKFSRGGFATDPYITIVAAPLLEPLGDFLTADPPGIVIDNYWDATVLAPYDILHCSLLAAQEGFSRSVKLPGTTDFLNDAQPLFFPLGEHMAKTVMTTDGTLHHTFLHSGSLQHAPRPYMANNYYLQGPLC